MGGGKVPEDYIILFLTWNLIPIQMVWIETPTNPLLKLVDIQGAADIVHQNEVCLLEDVVLIDHARNSHILAVNK